LWQVEQIEIALGLRHHAAQMDAEAMDASGSDQSGSSSDSDSDSVVDMDPSDMQQLMQLEADLKANPYVYDIHLQVRYGCTRSLLALERALQAAEAAGGTPATLTGGLPPH
jgi:hypothetical protein